MIKRFLEKNITIYNKIIYISNKLKAKGGGIYDRSIQ